MTSRSGEVDCPRAFFQNEDSRIRVAIFDLDPLVGDRWQEFVDRKAQSSIFHTSEWLRALQQSYGYEPVVFTLSHPGAELESGLPFCRIQSRFTGKRLVSLPFSDHCEPLGNEADIYQLLQGLPTVSEGMKYLEIRPTKPLPSANFSDAESFFLHRLDLKPSLEDIFQSFQKSSIQRSIRRAERLGIKLVQGRSDWHLETFYKLFVATRRRLQSPPQPIRWFRNLIASLGPKMNIMVAVQEDRPLASIITLHHKRTATYKYGCSDANLHHLSGMPFLLWKAIEAAKLSGALEFDFGRTDTDNAGLITFKSRWGTNQSRLTYLRYGDFHQRNWQALPGARILKKSFARLPESLFVGIGKLLYRHIG